MAMTYCVCGSWTVKVANFCHMCGNELSSNAHTFEASYGNDGGDDHGGRHHPGPSPRAITQGPGAKDKFVTTALFGMVAGAGALFADWDASWVAFAPMIYLAYDPVKEFVLGLAGRLPHEFSKDTTTTLRVEHHETSEQGRRFVGLYDLPDTIQIEHLQHVARVCLPLPAGEGAQFSRRKICKAGTLSQGQFEALRDAWLDSNHAFYRNPHAPNLGIVLTERCNRLLKKSLEIVVVDGGGWLPGGLKNHVLGHLEG